MICASLRLYISVNERRTLQMSMAMGWMALVSAISYAALFNFSWGPKPVAVGLLASAERLVHVCYGGEMKDH